MSKGDFVARAGAVIDRAHRMAGLLLVLVIIQSIMIVTMWSRNGNLSDTIERLATRLPVYVIPGSTRGIYSPTEDDLLINAFVDTVTQSFNTFTYETLAKQYQEMRQFFTAEMLTYSQTYFEKLMSDSQVDRRSQLFIPERQSLKVEKGMDGGVEARAVTLRGSLQTIIAGSVVESVPLEISLRLRKTIISKTNPFGFMLAGYNVRRLQAATAGNGGFSNTRNQQNDTPDTQSFQATQAPVGGSDYVNPYATPGNAANQGQNTPPSTGPSTPAASTQAAPVGGGNIPAATNP